MTLIFYVNGKRIRDSACRLDQSLASYLRERLQLTGCKVACGVGMCGSCTVLLSQRRDSGVSHEAVNACLLPLAACHHKAVTTVEGVGSVRASLHPVQSSVAEGHGVQCGFCTPGVVMSVYAALRSQEGHLAPEEVDDTLRGNLCRCTGYRPILHAVKSCCGGGCVPANPDLDPSQELIFPPELLMAEKEDVHLQGDTVSWFVPASWKRAESILRSHPDALVVGGNGTNVLARRGVEASTVVVCLSGLDCFALDREAQLSMGAGLTLAGLERRVREAAEEATPCGRLCAALLDVLTAHGSPQVKRVATVGGTLASLHIYPYLAVLLASLDVRVTVFDRRTSIVDDLPLSAVISAGFDHLIIGHVTVSLRGVQDVRYFGLRGRDLKFCLSAAVDGRGTRLSASYLAGEAYGVVTGDALLDRDELQGGDETAEYARLLYRGWAEQVSADRNSPPPRSPGAGTGCQPVGVSSDGVVGQPVVTTRAREATTGEAEFLDDQAPRVGELHMALVSSREAHARILSVDPGPALGVAGVVGFVSAEDVPCNQFVSVVPPADERVFAAGEVHFAGETVGAVVAESREAALGAAALVRVEYAPLPAVLSVEEAAAKGQLHKSLFCPAGEVSIGRVVEGGGEAEATVAGEILIEGQEHLYLEPQSALVCPGKEGDLVVHASSHDPNAIQRLVATVLGLSAHQVEVRVRPLGGSFGGKESRALVAALPAAVAAVKFRRPVRLVLPRDVDVRLSGGRHPVLGRYELRADQGGRIAAFKCDLTLDGGATLDCSTCVRDYCLFFGLNGYRVPTYSLTARACRTNRAPSTSFRGYGGPQAMMVVETAMEHLAERLGVCPDRLREENLVGKGDVNAFDVRMEDDNLRACWRECKARSEYERRRGEVAAFNREHEDRKRGLALIPVMHGVGFNVPFLNKGAAVIHVYATDGSVLLAHGGVEMGQGVEVKMRQVAAQSLGLPLALIRSQTLSTNVIANASPTASSGTADLIGPAVLDACAALSSRLQWRPADGETEEERVKRWRGAVTGAFFSRVNLTAYGYFSHPCPGLSTAQGGRMFYYTYGAACSEVELDVATGEYRLLRTDIVMDVGKSLNPAIDMGQVEGGFMQGYGLFCQERLSRDRDADRLPGRVVFDYAAPRVGDIPRQMNVHFLTDSRNTTEHAVYSSKGVGEPPLFLGSSVYFALRRALRAVHGEPGEFCRIDCPATSDRVKLAIHRLARE